MGKLSLHLGVFVVYVLFLILVNLSFNNFFVDYKDNQLKNISVPSLGVSLEQPSQRKDTIQKLPSNKPGLLILYDGIKTNILNNFITSKSQRYNVRVVSRDEVLTWCSNSQDCDTTELQIWAGKIPYYIKINGETKKAFPSADDLIDFCGDCMSSWPSQLKSYIHNIDQTSFGKSLQYVLVIGKPELLPYVPVWDILPTDN